MAKETKTILVVDDEGDLLELFKEELSWDGFSVLLANNLRNAIEHLNNSKIDIVLSDIGMPGGSGFDLLTHIRKMVPTQPKVFFVSGMVDLTNDEVRKMGGEGLFQKPFDIDEMIDTLMKAIK